MTAKKEKKETVSQYMGTNATQNRRILNDMVREMVLGKAETHTGDAENIFPEIKDKKIIGKIVLYGKAMHMASELKKRLEWD